MKPEQLKKVNKHTNLKISMLALLIFILIVTMLLGAGELIGAIIIPKGVSPYIGGILLGYVIVGIFTMVYLGAQSLLKNEKG